MTPKLNDPEKTTESAVLGTEADTNLRLVLEARNAQRSGVLRSELGSNSYAKLFSQQVPFLHHLGHLDL